VPELGAGGSVRGCVCAGPGARGGARELQAPQAEECGSWVRTDRWRVPSARVPGVSGRVLQQVSGWAAARWSPFLWAHPRRPHVPNAGWPAA
jgi:hypothetical protein